MTDKKSVRITAMSLARRRALAGVRTGATPSGRQTIGDVIVFGHRRTLIPGSRRERLTQNGVAGKWCRNGLKRLNPRPEMVWARKPRTHNIWYPGARLTARLRVTSCEKGQIAQLPSCPRSSFSTPLERRQMPLVGSVASRPRHGAGETEREIFRLATP